MIMKITLGHLRKLIREANGGHRERWPWIDHFDGKNNEEGVPHPGNWKNPTQADFDAALAKMSASDLAKLEQRAMAALGADDEMSYDIDSDDEPVEPDPDQVRAQMFKIWSDSEFRDQRDRQNQYFAPSRKRDADAYAKAMENPEYRKLAGMVASARNAQNLGKPWFPDKE